LISKKLETILIWIKYLRRDELERLSNETEAEIQFRDIDNKMEFGKESLDGWRTNEGGDSTKGEC